MLSSYYKTEQLNEKQTWGLAGEDHSRAIIVFAQLNYIFPICQKAMPMKQELYFSTQAVL